MSDTAVETIPQAGVWDIDEVHSSLEFVVRHLMATKVRGRFSEWTATLTTGSTPGDAKVEATIQAGVWDIDEVHSSLEFVVRHLMATKVRGRCGPHRCP